MAALDRIQARANNFKVGRAALALLAVMPFVLGYLAGTVVKVVKLVWAACVEGFEQGVKIG